MKSSNERLKRSTLGGIWTLSTRGAVTRGYRVGDQPGTRCRRRRSTLEAPPIHAFLRAVRVRRIWRFPRPVRARGLPAALTGPAGRSTIDRRRDVRRQLAIFWWPAGRRWASTFQKSAGPIASLPSIAGMPGAARPARTRSRPTPGRCPGRRSIPYSNLVGRAAPRTGRADGGLDLVADRVEQQLVDLIAWYRPSRCSALSVGRHIERLVGVDQLRKARLHPRDALEPPLEIGDDEFCAGAPPLLPAPAAAAAIKR